MWNGKSDSLPLYSNSSPSKICYFSKCKFVKFLCFISVFNDLIFFFRIFLISATAIQAWLWVLLKLSVSSKVLQVELSLFARWDHSARQKKKQSKAIWFSPTFHTVLTTESTSSLRQTERMTTLFCFPTCHRLAVIYGKRRRKNI